MNIWNNTALPFGLTIAPSEIISNMIVKRINISKSVVVDP